MRIAVTGSIATDHLMTFAGKFTDTLIPEKLDKISVSFLVGDLQIRRGGVAGNIAFGLGCLGQNPLLVGSVGPDFAEYRQWLDEHGVDTSGVRTSATQHRAVHRDERHRGQPDRVVYPGAISEDGEIDIVALAQTHGVGLVLIGAGDPGAMQRYTADCRKAGVAFAADFSQQVAFLDGDTMRTLVEGAAYLFSNEYEEAVIESKTGWSSADVLERVGTRVVTLGGDGAKVERRERPRHRRPGQGRQARGPDLGPETRSGRLHRGHRVGAAGRAGDPARQPDGGAGPGDGRPAGV